MSLPAAGGELRVELDRLVREILPGGRRALDRLLPVFAGFAGTAAAVYLRSERGFRREAATGGAFPEHLEAPPAAALAFDGGLLVWEPAGAARELSTEASGLALAVAAAAREVQLAHRLRAQDFEAKTRGVQLEALYDVGLAIASTLDFEPLCEEILMRAVSLADARRGALYLGDGGNLLRLERAFGGDAAPQLELDSEEVASLLAGRAAPNCCALPGAQFLFGVPILSDGEARGVLVVGDKESRRGVGPFRDEDRRTLELLANQAAIALANAELHRQALEKERLEREVELASQIQRQILPTAAPDVPGYQVHGWNRPARHVGGDYYDFLALPDGTSTALVVGDVSGKGVPAALLVSTLHSALHLLAEREPLAPAMCERLNRLILESSSANKFITLFVAELAPRTGRLRYINAGHNPALLRRAGGTLEELPASGMPLGLIAEARFRADEVGLAPGDLLCLYSDGITEAAAPDDEEFGCGRLAGLLADGAALSLADLTASIDRAVVEFAAGRPQADDQTLVLLRRDA
jgi:sigma-B regulation protein RsbU (phosphoserine phosphatase)